MARSWYVQHKGKTVGPASSNQLKELAGSGKITPQTLVRLGEGGEWQEASRVDGLFEERQSLPATIEGATPPPHTSPPPPPQQPMPAIQPAPQPQQYVPPPPTVIHQQVVVDSGTSNAVAGLASFFFPGLGQLIQGRIGAAIGFFVFWMLGIALCFVIIGVFFLPLVWIGSIVDAARYRR